MHPGASVTPCCLCCCLNIPNKKREITNGKIHGKSNKTVEASWRARVHLVIVEKMDFEEDKTLCCSSSSSCCCLSQRQISPHARISLYHQVSARNRQFYLSFFTSPPPPAAAAAGRPVAVAVTMSLSDCVNASKEKCFMTRSWPASPIRLMVS